jgi:hypothetical protein
VLVSTTDDATLRRMREVAPDVRLGWSIPGLRRNPLASPLLVLPALAGVQVLPPGVPAPRARGPTRRALRRRS